MKIQAKTMAEFWAGCGDRKDEVKAIHKIITEATSHKGRLFSGMGAMTVLAYKVGKYKASSGEVEKWPLISLAPQKNYISIYICAVKNKQYLMEKYEGKLGKVNASKSCLRFKKVEDLNLPELKKLLKETIKEKNPFAYEQ